MISWLGLFAISCLDKIRDKNLNFILNKRSGSLDSNNIQEIAIAFLIRWTSKSEGRRLPDLQPLDNLDGVF